MESRIRIVARQGPGHGTQTSVDFLTPPNLRRFGPFPDYLGLIDVLLNLRQPLDLTGETILTSDDAAQIRACGVEARAGKWYCPPLPASVVGTVWRLSYLSDEIDPATRPVPWREKRAAICHVSVDPLSKFERLLIRRLQNAPDRRALRRKYRSYGVRLVDFTIDRLIAGDYITEHGGMLYPLSKAALSARFEAESHPRRPVPVSVIY